MTNEVDDTPLSGVLSVAIDGRWTAHEMGELFARMDRVYRRLLAGEHLLSREMYGYDYAYRWYTRSLDESQLDAVEESAIVARGALVVRRLEYASPGAAEVIGALNPLKVASDAVNEWRHENTLRTQHADAVTLEKRRLDQEQERIDLQRQNQADQYRLQLIDHLQQLPSPIAETLITRLITEPLGELEAVASDVRVGDVEVRGLEDDAA